MTIEAYPLAWPAGWKRTKSRTHAAYQVEFAQARDELIHSLELLRARRQTIVLSTNIALRRDGLPYADFREPDDPGVAVYWDQYIAEKWEPRVIACDRWSKVKWNVRACGMAIDALRSLHRCGASEIMDRAFQGFNALPAVGQTGLAPWWATELGLESLAGLKRETVEERFRELAKERHPDRGGTHEAFVNLSKARSEAMAWIGTGL